LAALADPIRWRVLQLLGGGERCVCDLEAATGLAQSRLSYHLGILREAELICGRREGRWSYYSLNREALTRVSDRLIELSTQSAGPSRALGTSECAASG
jgi:ArsR family transcriptional regulator